MLIILMPPHQTHTHNLGTFFVMEHRTLLDYFMFQLQCFFGPQWLKPHINTNIEYDLVVNRKKTIEVGGPSPRLDKAHKNMIFFINDVFLS